MCKIELSPSAQDAVSLHRYAWKTLVDALGEYFPNEEMYVMHDEDKVLVGWIRTSMEPRAAFDRLDQFDRGFYLDWTQTSPIYITLVPIPR